MVAIVQYNSFREPLSHRFYYPDSPLHPSDVPALLQGADHAIGRGQ